jgi:hypothetical protein
MNQRIRLKLDEHLIAYGSGTPVSGWRLWAMADVYDGIKEVCGIKNWLVDTGSMDTVLPQHVWKRLTIQENDTRAINLGGNNQMSCIVTELQLRLVGLPSEADFASADTCEPPQTEYKSVRVLCHPGNVKIPILGMNFMQRFRAQLVCDVSKQLAYFDVPTHFAS